MKKALLAFIATLVSATALGQGTIQFLTTPDGAHAVPVHASFRISSGEFALFSDGSFSGVVGVTHFPSPTAVSIYSSTSPTLLGTKVYDLVPGLEWVGGHDGSPGGQNFDFNRTLGSTEVNDLIAGNWWINVSTTDFPNGELRGQIIAVPEPSSIFLIGSTLGALYSLRYRRLKNS